MTKYNIDRKQDSILLRDRRYQLTPTSLDDIERFGQDGTLVSDGLTSWDDCNPIDMDRFRWDAMDRQQFYTWPDWG